MSDTRASISTADGKIVSLPNGGKRVPHLFSKETVFAQNLVLLIEGKEVPLILLLDLVPQEIYQAATASI